MQAGQFLTTEDYEVQQLLVPDRTGRAHLIFALLVIAGAGMASSDEFGQVVDTGVILSTAEVKKAAEWLPDLDLSPPYWLPTAGDVAQLESTLRAYLSDVANEQHGGFSHYERRQAGEIAGKLDRYRRQYLGFESRGKKWILVNGFCEHETDKYWLDHFMRGVDGGSCYFVVRYSISNSHFERLEINDEP